MKCALDGCENEVRVAAKPTLYCSMECRKEMNRQRDLLRARDHAPIDGRPVRGGKIDPYADQVPRIRTETQLRSGKVGSSAVTHCLCGGMLAQSDRGAVWCLRCEEMPAEVVHAGRLR